MSLESLVRVFNKGIARLNEPTLFRSELLRLRLLIFSDDDKVSAYILFANSLKKYGIETTVARTFKYCFVSQEKPFSLFPSPRMLGLIKRINPDIVLTNYPYYVSHLSKLVNRFFILYIGFDMWSEVDIDRNTSPAFYSRAYAYYLSAIKEACIKKADLVLLNSQWLQTQFKKHLPNQPHNVLYEGIDSNMWNPRVLNQKLDLKHPAVAGVFQLNQYRKVLGLLRFIRVIKRMPDVNFFFAGTGPYSSLIKKYSLPNLFFLGRLSQSEVKGMLEGCDVFVHPSGLDAFPRSVKEASLLEKPIVASNVGGIPEIIRDNETGYLCEIDNIDEWVEKIRFFLDNPNIASMFGKRAREYVLKKFDWDRLAESFVETLKSSNNSVLEMSVRK